MACRVSYVGAVGGIGCASATGGGTVASIGTTCAGGRSGHCNATSIIGTVVVPDAVLSIHLQK